METIKKWAQILFIAAVALPVFRQDFPTMAFLYAIVTGASLAMGLGCLLGPGTAAAWEKRGVDRAVQRRWSRVRRHLPGGLAAGPVCGIRHGLHSPGPVCGVCDRRSGGSGAAGAGAERRDRGILTAWAAARTHA